MSTQKITLYKRLATFVLISLITQFSSAQVFRQGYRVRSSPSLSSTVLGSTSDDCQLTGVHSGVSRQVKCTNSNGSFTGWVNRKGVTSKYRYSKVSTIRQSLTTAVKAVGTALAPLVPAFVAPIGGVLKNLSSALLNLTPKRVTERRVISAKSGKKGNVDLIEMPEAKVSGDPLGSPLCGSYRARNRSPLYFTPQAGCLMSAVAQKWRIDHCKDNDKDCRLVVGDASHGHGLPSSWPHSTHRDGRCIDIYLPRKDGAGLTSEAGHNNTSSYARTAELVKILVAHGAAPNSYAAPGSGVLHNSTIANTIDQKNHDNHIHVCFPERSSNQKICDNTEFDTGICPEMAPAAPAKIPQTDDGDDFMNPSVS